MIQPDCVAETETLMRRDFKKACTYSIEIADLSRMLDVVSMASCAAAHLTSRQCSAGNLQLVLSCTVNGQWSWVPLWFATCVMEPYQSLAQLALRVACISRTIR